MSGWLILIFFVLVALAIWSWSWSNKQEKRHAPAKEDDSPPHDGPDDVEW
jgi:hypothetical protein